MPKPSQSKDKIAIAQAREAGDKTYETAYPCVFGHEAIRYVVNKGCVECARSSSKHSYKKASGSVIDDISALTPEEVFRRILERKSDAKKS